jgi:hypothetical protein
LIRLFIFYFILTAVEGAMSADLNVNQIEEKISVLDHPEESARVDCNGNGKVNDHHGPDPVCAEDSVADQVGQLKADRVESESITGFRDDNDPIEKEEDLQARALLFLLFEFYVH